MQIALRYNGATRQAAATNDGPAGSTEQQDYGISRIGKRDCGRTAQGVWRQSPDAAIRFHRDDFLLSDNPVNQS